MGPECWSIFVVFLGVEGRPQGTKPTAPRGAEWKDVKARLLFLMGTGVVAYNVEIIYR